jgi:hypothetical protein
MADLERVRDVTEHYERLQGLRRVALGVPFLLSASWRAGWLGGWPSRDPRVAGYWFLTSLGLAVAVSYVIRAWYRRRFGIAQSTLWRGGALPLLAVSTAFLAVVFLPIALSWVPLAAFLFLSAVFTSIGLKRRVWRPHYLPVAGIWVVFAILSVGGVPVDTRDVALDVAIGLSLIIAGLGDDRVLKGALRPPLAEDYARPL